MRARILLFALLLCGAAWNTHAQTAPGNTCSQAAPACVDANMPVFYPASSGGNSTGSYGCLATAPNPGWFYFQSDGGPVTFELDNTSGVDIDFALWGPYPNLSAALGACSGLSGTSPIDCSYSPNAQEIVNVPSAPLGSYFLMVITNFDGSPTSIVVSAISGQTNCGILTCQVEAGSLSGNSYAGCFLNPDFPTISENPNYGGAGAPDPSEYTATYVIAQDGVFTTEDPNPNYGNLPPGNYTICPYVYANDEAPAAQFFPLGQTPAQVSADLDSGSPSYCADLGDNCIDVTVYPPVDPGPLTEVTICVGDVFVAPDGNSYSQIGTIIDIVTPNYNGCDSTSSYILLPGPTSASVITESVCQDETVEINGTDYGPGTYNETLVNYAGCDSILTIIVLPIFNDAMIVGSSPVIGCDISSSILTNAGAGDTFEWTDPQGMVVGNGPDYVATEGGCYTLTVTTTDPGGITCTDTDTYCITALNNPSFDPEIIWTNPGVCPGEPLTFLAVAPGATDYDWNLTDACAQITGGQASETITVDAATCTTLSIEVCLAVEDLCGPVDPVCTTFTLPTVATVDAGSDEAVCALTYPLSATAGGPVSWSQITGPGTATFADPDSSQTTVTVPAYGSYTFAVSGAGPCGGTDEVTITFNENPALVVGSLTETCDATNGSYVVTFTVNGGIAPYTTTGGTFQGNMFTSTPIPSGDPYSFSITDLNGCGPLDVNGSFTCNCTTDAGTMSTTPLDACADGTVSATHNGDETLDGDDGFAYYLHDNAGTSLGTVLAQNGSGTFGYQTGMTYGQTYYISYAAADAQGGGIDLNDACLSVAAGQPVVFYQLPTSNAGANDGVCGTSYTLSGSTNVGTGSWSQAGGPGTASFGDNTSATTTVDVDVFGDYTFTWTADNNGCTDADAVTITFSDAPELVAGSLTETCNGANTSYVVSFSVGGGTAPYTATGGIFSGNTFTSNPIASGDPYSFSITDSEGCGPLVVSGSFTCNCTTDAGTMSNTLLELCEDETATAQHNGDETLDADDVTYYFLHDAPGSSLGNVVGTTLGTFNFNPANMAYGQTYYMSLVAASDDGISGNVDLDDPCLSVAPGQPVVWYENPTADAGADDNTCGLTYELAASLDVGTGTWSQTGGPGTAGFSDPNSATSEVTVDVYGSYTFTWTADNNGCADSDAVVVTFGEAPITDALTEICDATNTTYTVSFTISGGAAPYTVTGGASTVSGGTFTSDPIPSGTAYSFAVSGADGCGPVVLTGSRTCDCDTDAGTMSTTPLDACEDATVTATHNGDETLDGNDGFAYFLHDNAGTSLGTVLAQNASGTFGYQASMTYGQTYYISYAAADAQGGGIDLGDGCLSVAAGQPVVFYQLPTADAGADDSTCGLTYELAASQDVGTGSWSQSGGPGTASFADVADATTSVTVPDFGSYTFAWTVDNNGCTDTDEVGITFAAGPALDGTVSETCDPVTLAYTVSFTLGGGTAPYTVAGAGTLSGNVYTSDPIPSGTAYSFSVLDADGCGPLVIEGMRNCNCSTDAGQMDFDPVEVCADATAATGPAAGSTLDPNDNLVYYLHDAAGSQLGTVYASAPSPAFTLQTGMSTGSTYYISAVAGNAAGADVDLGDDCLSVAPGTPVVWTALPGGSLTQNGPICAGGSAALSFGLTGNGPFTLDLADGTQLVNQQNGSTYTVTPTTTTTYTLVGVTDANGCSSTFASAATVTVNVPPVATVTPAVSVCNAADNGNVTTLDFATLVTDGDQSGSFTNVGGVGAGNFPVLDFTGVAPGNYSFTYTTGGAQAPCANETYGIDVVVEDCVCPSVATAPAAPLCNDGGVLDLASLQLTGQPGSWTATAAPTGAALPVLDGTLFDPAGLAAGPYTFTFTLATAPPAGCAGSATQTVTVEAAADAGTAGPDLVVCSDSPEVIDLNAQLTNADAGGTWTLANGVSPGFDGGSSFDPAAAAPGTYQFTYTVGAAAPCIDAVSAVAITVQPLPVADAGPDRVGTCDEPLVTLGGTATSDQVSYRWRAANGAFPGDSTVLNPELGLPGVYTLTVTNLATGCSASDEVTVAANQDVPVPDISLVPVSCFGEVDGAIVVQGVSGGVPPYVFSLNGSAFGQSGVFTGLAPDEYTLQVEDANGCANEFKINIEQPQELDVTIVAFLDDDNTIRLGDSVQLAAQTTLPADSLAMVAWTPPGVLSCDTCVATLAQPLETTLFTVTVESNGCSDSDALTVFVNKERLMFAPTAFSPNGDGGNETFFVYFDEQVVLVSDFSVYNRWGELVYQIFDTPPNDAQFGWDGTFRGEPLNPAVFVWYTTVVYRDGTTETVGGDVTLMR